jgi:hypothetical protein
MFPTSKDADVVSLWMKTIWNKVELDLDFNFDLDFIGARRRARPRRGLREHNTPWQAGPYRRRVAARSGSGAAALPCCGVFTGASAAAGSDAYLATAPVTRPCIATVTIVTPSCRS